MKKIAYFATAGALAVLLTVGAEAEGLNLSEETNVEMKAGTLGIGLDISKMLNEKLSLRANINGINYNRNEVLDDVNYDADLKLLTIGVLADYYPMENNFRISGGVYYNGNKLDATATPTQSVTIGNQVYTAGQIGRLDTTVDFNKVSPYLGLGWGNKASKSGWGFSVDLGAMYQGSPNVTAKAVANIPGLQTQLDQDVEVERKKIEDDMDSYRWYPVVMVGVTYTF
jgi:hypothetical protein